MKITKIIGYKCDFCKKEYKLNKELINIDIQYNGMGEWYEHNFCNIECLKKEIEKHHYEEEYIYRLKRILKKENDTSKNRN